MSCNRFILPLSKSNAHLPVGGIYWLSECRGRRLTVYRLGRCVDLNPAGQCEYLRDRHIQLVWESVCVCVCMSVRLTVIAEAVSTAGDDHGISQHLLADQTEEFFGDGVLVI